MKQPTISEQIERIELELLNKTTSQRVDPAGLEYTNRINPLAR